MIGPTDLLLPSPAPLENTEMLWHYEVNLSVFTLWRKMGRVEEQLDEFLISALDGDRW